MNSKLDMNIIVERGLDNHLIQDCGGETFCPVCGAPLITFIDRDTDKPSWRNPTQKAHRLSNDKPNKKKYGSIIIEDPLNHFLVCSLNCNNDIQVRNNPVEEQKILIEILDKQIKADPIIFDVKKMYEAWCSIGDCIIDDNHFEEMYLFICNYFMIYERSLE